jgi:hypothetical protein
MTPSSFFTRQERTVTFTTIVNPDSWTATPGVTFTAPGIVAIGSQSVDPSKENGVSTSSVRLFFKLSEMEKLTQVKIGSTATVDGVTYAITKIDLRGVIAGFYPLRLEGARK